MEWSKTGYKPSKIVQKIFADLFVYSGANFGRPDLCLPFFYGKLFAKRAQQMLEWQAVPSGNLGRCGGAIDPWVQEGYFNLSYR